MQAINPLNPRYIKGLGDLFDLVKVLVGAINLNQFQVVFNKEVDKDTAITAGNYIVNGVDVDANDNVVLLFDNKTVVVTLDTAIAQYKKVTVVVKKAVLSKDLIQTAPRFEKEVVFSDTAVPTVKSVKADGNKKLTVEFSEAIAMTAFDGSKFKINDLSAINFGYKTPGSVAAAAVNETAGLFANKVVLEFEAALPSGTNTLEVPAATTNWFEDAAKFLGVKTKVSFTVDATTNAPSVVSVTGENNGTVYVTYNRAMDSTLAQDEAKYTINGVAASAADFKANTDSKVVKLTFGTVTKGANVLVIDNVITDTFGNKLHSKDDLRVSFDATVDTTKPTVSSVTLLDNKTVRIKFSETVNATFAQSTANYTLKDSSGTTKTGDINQINKIGTGTNSDVYDIAMKTDKPLTGSNYSLTIKNIQDLAATPNVMDNYTTTISGNDNVEPTVKYAVAVDGSTTKVTVYFSEAMNSSDLANSANYAYGYDGTVADGTLTYKALPSSANIEVASDNKSVTLVFPSSYAVEVTAAGTTEYFVHGVRVANVKDAAGNILSGIIATPDVVAPASATDVKPSLVAKSSKAYMSGSTLVVEFEYDQLLSTLDKADFLVATKEADSAYLYGKKVVLQFTDSAKKLAVKAAGSAQIAVDATPASKNAAGVPVVASETQNVYDDAIAPELLTGVADIVADESADTIVVTFSEKIDGTIAGLYKNDFEFVNKTTGKVLEATAAAVDVGVTDTQITFTFANLALNVGDVVTIKAKSTVDIKDLQDPKEEQNLYAPDSDDLNGYDETVVL